MLIYLYEFDISTAIKYPFLVECLLTCFAVCISLIIVKFKL